MPACEWKSIIKVRFSLPRSHARIEKQQVFIFSLWAQTEEQGGEFDLISKLNVNHPGYNGFASIERLLTSQ